MTMMECVCNQFVLTVSEEDGFPGVHAGEGHDVQV